MKTLIAVIVGSASGSAIAGLSNPFTETFDGGANNWLNGGFGPATEFASGGDGDSGYVGSQTGFEFSDPEAFNVVFRGNTGFFPGTDASGGAFFGDWIAGGVTELSFSIRHNIPVPVTVFARIAANTGGGPFPGTVAVAFIPVVAGEWTEVTIAIDASNPQFVSFEGSTFENVFSNVGFIQIGVAAPDALLGNPAIFDVGLENVSIVPAPAGVLALAGVVWAGRRRR